VRGARAKPQHDYQQQSSHELNLRKVPAASS
jgi:hypothetical protein